MFDQQRQERHVNTGPKTLAQFDYRSVLIDSAYVFFDSV